MAEQFNKLYISASEFIRAWEKEIYELTNLDYFVFLVMNTLATRLENIFFPKQASLNHNLVLNSDEITGLAFRVGDNLQLFFERNCFGVCTLNCPTQTEQRVKTEELINKGQKPENNEFALHSYSTKEQCLKYDLSSYVVFDSIIDFYRYDLQIAVRDEEPVLQSMMEFIGDTIIELVKKDGAAFLTQPAESAGNLFQNMLHNEENNWNDFDSWQDEDEDDDESEPWKSSAASVVSGIEEFLELDQAKNDIQAGHLLKLLGRYITGFISISNLEEFVYEDLEEFFLIVVPSELSLEEDFHLQEELAQFERFVTYLDYKHDMQFNRFWRQFAEESLEDFDRTFRIAHAFHQEHSYLVHQLEQEEISNNIIDGFFEVLDRHGDYFVLQDIHLLDKYEKVLLDDLDSDSVQAGDILNLQLIEGPPDTFRSKWLEVIYCNKAKLYLA